MIGVDRNFNKCMICFSKQSHRKLRLYYSMISLSFLPIFAFLFDVFLIKITIDVKTNKQKY